MALRGLWGSFFSRYGGAAFSRPVEARLRRGLRSRVELVVGAPGILLANILAAAASKEGKPSSEIISTLVRWGVIALATAVGLRFMGLANDIIVLAFGLILGAVAVAVAIAFGVGGRDAAKRLLDRWTSGA